MNVSAAQVAAQSRGVSRAMKRSLASVVRLARRPRPTEAPNLDPLCGTGDPIALLDEDQELDQELDEELDSATGRGE